MRAPFILALTTLSALLAGCEAASSRQIVGVQATGTAFGVVYVDRDGDGAPGSPDVLAANVRVTLTREGALSPTTTALTDARGVYRINGMPVGSYRLGVDPSALGDSLQLMRADSSWATVAAYDSVPNVVVLGIRPATAATIRGEAPGKLLSVVGVALSASGTFSDTSVYISDATGALRVAPMLTGGLAVGDSIRVVGRTGSRNGQTVLVGGAAFRLGKAAPPTADSLSTRAASTAADGGRDASLVRVVGNLIAIDASSPDVKLTIDDGSGPLEVFLDRAARITPNTTPVLGARVNATGLLAPREEGSGRWRLKPRGAQDVKLM